MTATSGFKITFTAFLPCENRLDALLAGSKVLADVEAALKGAGLIDVKRTDTFVKVQRQRNSEGPSGTTREVPSSGVRPAAPPSAATEAAPLPESAGGGEGDDLLSIPASLQRPRPAA